MEKQRIMSPIAYADFWESFLPTIYSLVLIIIAVVIVYYILRARGKPVVVTKTLVKGDNLGFGVSVERKMIKDARVRCNNISYAWEDGAKLERKDLGVGDAPSSFFPYQVAVEYVDDISKDPKWNYDKTEGMEPCGGVLITVKEITTRETVHVCGYPIPKNVKTPFVFARNARDLFSASVRIIGEGVDERRDYSLNVGLDSPIVSAIREGKSLMDYVSYSFALKKHPHAF